MFFTILFTILQICNPRGRVDNLMNNILARAWYKIGIHNIL